MMDVPSKQQTTATPAPIVNLVESEFRSRVDNYLRALPEERDKQGILRYQITEKAFVAPGVVVCTDNLQETFVIANKLSFKVAQNIEQNLIGNVICCSKNGLLVIHGMSAPGLVPRTIHQASLFAREAFQRKDQKPIQFLPEPLPYQ
jgi:hypothetical protein